MPAPSMIAMSATLKIPVRTGPIPTFMKSITIPYVIRSKRLEAPPATKRATPSGASPRQRSRLGNLEPGTGKDSFRTGEARQVSVVAAQKHHAVRSEPGCYCGHAYADGNRLDFVQVIHAVSIEYGPEQR